MSRKITGIAAAALVTLMAPAPAPAFPYDKLAYMTFSAPVQVPGATLTAGTYRFRLANPDTSRNVLQVLSGDGTIVFAMFHTIPDVRTVLTDEPTVTFRETPAGVAPAVKTLFYGGEYHGYEFIYPKGGPNMIAEVFPQPEVTYTANPPTPALEPAAEAAVEPAPEPVAEHAEVAAPEAVVDAAPAPEAEQLPRTATSLPATALGGASLLVLGLAFGLVRRYIN
jgi:hypothetical protein